MAGFSVVRRILVEMETRLLTIRFYQKYPLLVGQVILCLVLSGFCAVSYAENSESLLPSPPLPPAALQQEQATPSHQAASSPVTRSNPHRASAAVQTDRQIQPQVTPEQPVAPDAAEPALTLPAAAPQPQAVAQAPTPNTAEEPLFPQRTNRYTSVGFIAQVFGLLAILLCGFYLLARFVLLPLVSAQAANLSQKPADPAGGSPLGFFKTLAPQMTFSRKDYAALQPKILSKVRLGPTKEIHVVQIGEKRLVVGSTPQHMTLLADLTSPQGTKEAASTLEEPDKTVYQKYLTPPAQQPTPHTKPTSPPIPQEEEIVILDDYPPY